jgi:hypothetical protein
MLYLIPTKRGIGVEVWGTYEDLSTLYDVISQFWSDEKYQGVKGFESRDQVISGFSYHIRKAKEGSRLKRPSGHFFFEKQEYFGCKMSWVQIMFSLTAIKFNMRFHATTKFDIANILLLEYWIEKAMRTFDEVTANQLIGFIEDGLFGGNNYIYQYMRCIELDYILLGGGKKSFQKLPQLLKKGVYLSNEFKQYEMQLQEDAKRLNCEITDLELNDQHIDYSKIKW